jgi:adenine-specific DNA-methyltransferase
MDMDMDNEKNTNGQLDGGSLDIAGENRRKLRQLFPAAFTETVDGEGRPVESVDFEKLKAELGTFTDLFEGRRERYGLDWPGKKDVLRLIQQPTYGSLKPRKAESADWDSTGNLFVEGDNLEVLKLLQKAYYGKVRLVHIDPPYNTDGDFIYPDNYTENLETYLEYTGQTAGDGKKFSTVTEEDGRYHSRWLNMMYPRLYLARNLLADDGVILIHIDEHESENLRLVMNEIFGAENDLGEIVWDKKNPKGDSTKVASQHEKIVAFTKNIAYLKEARELKRPKANAEKMVAKAAQLVRKIGTVSVPADLEEAAGKYGLTIDAKRFAKPYALDNARRDYREWLSKQDVSGGEAAYKFLDDDGEVFRTVSMAWPNKKTAPDEYFEPLIHPETKKPCPVPDRGWRNPRATMAELLKAGRIIFGEDETKQPERKYLLKENMDENVPSVLPFGGSDDALLKRLGIPFDNPKPVDFVKSVVSHFSGDGGIVLDFFAGSATVGHACMELQAEGKPLEFVLVQLPERLDPKKAEQKAGVQFCKKLGVPENLAEIAKERLRRAAKEIAARGLPPPGFRTFSLTASNFRKWQKLSAESPPEQIAEQLELHVEHVSPDASQDDLLFEVLLKAGFKPTEKVEEISLAGIPVHSVAGGALLLCLAPSVTKELIDAVAEAEPVQFVCLDSAFGGNDQLKANAVQTFAARNQGRENAAQIVFRTV